MARKRTSEPTAPDANGARLCEPQPGGRSEATGEGSEGCLDASLLRLTEPRSDRTRAAAGRGRLFIAAGIALLLFTAFNVAIHFLARHTQRQRLLANLEHLPLGTECLFLGNSVVEAGCDPIAFKAAWTDTNHLPVTANVALGATTPVEHFLILHHAFDRPVRPKYLIYGFFDDQLFAASSGRWSELIGNRAFSYYFPAEAARFYAPGSTLAAWRLGVLARIPALAERSSLWDMVERFRRRLDRIGLAKPKTNRYGRVADFSALEPADAASFAQRCRTIVETHQPLSAPVRALIDLARQRGSQVILVEMPVSPQHRRQFYSTAEWNLLRAHLERVAAEAGASYLSASDWVTQDDDFDDTLHLNERGAEAFSARLASRLSREQDSPQTNASAVSSGGARTLAKAGLRPISR